jgi:hypothetical protein
MIEVPERVKDALRSGDYRKNYKITIPDMSVGAEPVSEVVVNYGDTGWTYLLMYNFDDQHHWIGYEETIWNHNFMFAEDYVRVDVRSDTYPFEELRFDGVWQDTVKFAGTATGTVYNVTAGEHSIVTRTATEDMTQPYSLPLHIICYGEKHTIDNNNLVAESVKFDERMCSDSELKFGLCEGTSVEFQYFGLANINGQRINIEIEIEYKDENGDPAWHTIPMGWYTVAQCPVQISTGIRKVTAYNKLQSSLLDESIKSQIISMIQDGEGGSSNGVAIGVILDELMGGYQESKVVPIAPYPLTSSEQSGIPYNYRIYDSDGQETNSWLFAWSSPTLSAIQDRIAAAYYRYEIDCHEICSFLDNYTITNPVTGTSMSPLDFNVGANLSVPYTLRDVLSREPEPYQEYPKLMRYILRSEMPEAGTRVDIDRAIYKDGYTDKQDITGWNQNLYIEETLVSTSGSIYCGGMMFYIPGAWKVMTFSPGFVPGPGYDPFTTDEKEAGDRAAVALIRDTAQAFQLSLDSIEAIKITSNDIEDIGDVTLRQLQSAVFELSCLFGRLDRVTDMFAGMGLSRDRLVPAETLYPADALTPQGSDAGSSPSCYQKLWTDRSAESKYRNIIATYKDTNGNEAEIQQAVNVDGDIDYIISDNWLLRNLKWTAVKIGGYLEEMSQKLADITWFPFEMWAPGLPYLEAGDEIEISAVDETHTSYILRRTLSGIQNLQDEMINGTLDIF